MTDDEIIVYALAHTYATHEFLAAEDEGRIYELLIERGTALGIDVPYGEEYQRAVLYRLDPERVPDYPYGETCPECGHEHGRQGWTACENCGWTVRDENATVRKD